MNRPESVMSKYVPAVPVPVGIGIAPAAVASSPPSRASSASGRLASSGRHALVTAAAAATSVASTHAHIGAADSTSGTALAQVPHSTRGPYHSPLQRQLVRLYPEYTEAQLSLHSRFTHTFYLGPPCRSLDDAVEAVDLDGSGGGRLVRFGASSSSGPPSARPDNAGYTIGTASLAPTSANATTAPLYSSLPPLGQGERALLQSSFDRVDAVYPPPGSTRAPSAVTAALEAIGRGRSPQTPGDQQEALPAGVRRQIIPRSDANSGGEGGGGAAYDVFHLPAGFKVVRDDAAPAPWPTDTPESQSTADAASALVRQRVRGVLEGLAQKYGSGGEPEAAEEEKQQSGARPGLDPANFAATPTVAPAPAASAPQSSVSSRRATTSRLDPVSGVSAPSGPNAQIAHQHHFTPGPEIEAVSVGTSRKDASASLLDHLEVIDYSALDAKRSAKTRKSKKETEQNQVVVGKPTKVTLLTRIKATVRCCCLVPQTHSVWTAQRDPVLVIRDRLTGKSLLKPLDTPSLIWCMLLIGDVMWMGTETGVILAYSVHTHKKLKQQVGHSGGVHCLARGPGGGVFSGSNDFTMVQWDTSLESVRAYNGHAGGVRCILPLSAGRVWTGGDEGAIRVWDAETGATIEELVRHTGSVLSLVTTGETIWSASEDGTMCMWRFHPDIACLKQIATGSDRIQTLMLVGRQVWSCGQDPRIHIWNAADMEWLGALKGHSRYLSSFVKVRVMETRIVWSYGLGEEHMMMWRAEAVCEDAHDKYVALLSQFTTQQAEIAHLRARVDLAEAARAALEAARDRERDLFARQLEDLLLQLAQASAARAAAAEELAKARDEAAALASQNARLRNELRLHLERLRAGEEVARALVDRVDAKDAHVSALEQDALAQAARWRERLARLEADHEALLRVRDDADANQRALADELQAVRARNAELERRHLEGAEGAEFYARENTRLRDELAALQASSTAADAAARARAANAAETNAALEKHVMELTTARNLAQAEAAKLSAELAAAQAALQRSEADRLADQRAAADQRALWEAQQRANAEAAARAAAALQAQTRRGDRLDRSRADLQSRVDSLLATLGAVAREMQHVERRVHGLSKPSHDVYATPPPQDVTFQQLAARRAHTYAHGESMPPALFFDEVTDTHRQVSRIMKRCLDETQKLHVGYSPAAAGLMQEEAREARRAAQVQPDINDPAMHVRPFTAPSPPLHSSDDDRASPPPTTSLGLDEDEYVGENTLVTDPAASPVRDVWINTDAQGAATARDTAAGYSALPLPLPPSGLLGAHPPAQRNAHSDPLSSSFVHPSPASNPRSASPLITYDLDSLLPRAASPPIAVSDSRLGVDPKQRRVEFASREAKLMGLEAQRNQRKIALRRDRQRNQP